MLIGGALLLMVFFLLGGDSGMLDLPRLIIEAIIRLVTGG